MINGNYSSMIHWEGKKHNPVLLIMWSQIKIYQQLVIVYFSFTCIGPCPKVSDQRAFNVQGILDPYSEHHRIEEEFFSIQDHSPVQHSRPQSCSTFRITVLFNIQYHSPVQQDIRI